MNPFCTSLANSGLAGRKMTNYVMNKSKYSLNIDAGGTMTDAVLSGAGRALLLKVESTPHDLTLSLMQIIERAGELTDAASTAEFLSNVAFIRWSSTVTSNALAERKGPPLGLMVTAGHEASLYGSGPSPAVGAIIDPDQIMTIDDTSPDPAVIMEKVRRLLEKGVRRICVSLNDSYRDRTVEQDIKRIINSQYPGHFLGSVPVLLGTDMLEWPDDMTRTHYALINAYTHPALAKSLFRAEDRLREDFNWLHPFLVGHTNGGVARIGKTKAIDTIESGPVFGTFGAAFMGTRTGASNLLCLDVGGTTTKASAVRNGQPVRQTSGDLFGIGINMPMQLLRSVAIGGGSHVRLNGGGSVEVGPESAGASPGPACYGLGGHNPTLTDALLTLGYLNPPDFLDGRRTLDVPAAKTALEREIAEPVSISVTEAALAARDLAATRIGKLLEAAAAAAGMPMTENALAVYGGNGPLLGPFVADRMGVKRLYVPLRFGPVFGAFGTATCDVRHVYHRNVSDLSGRWGIDAMLAAARRELHSEGFDHEQAEFYFEIHRPDEDPQESRRSWTVRHDADITAIADALAQGSADGAGRNHQILELRVTLPLPPIQLDTIETTGPAAAPSKGEMNFIFSTDPEGQPQALTGALYDPASLCPGQTIPGPALISGGTTSCIIPPHWCGRIDSSGNCWLERG